MVSRDDIQEGRLAQQLLHDKLFSARGRGQPLGEEDCDFYYDEKEMKMMMAMALIKTFMRKYCQL